MTRVYVNKRVGRHQLQRYLATMEGVQAELETEARATYARAKRIHEAHYLTGASSVFIEKGKIDWHVGIQDTGKTVEKARSNAFGVAWQTGALHKAFNLQPPRLRRSKAGRKRSRKPRRRSR